MMGIGILITGVIAWALIQAVSRYSPGTSQPPVSSPSAKETLDARLARGEIGIEEYRKLRETLESH